MFNFFRRKPIAENDPFRRMLPNDGLAFDEFKGDDVAVKFWLPEPLDQRIKQLSEYFGVTRPKFLRVTFFIHLYGRYRLEQMRQQVNSGLFFESPIMQARGGGTESDTPPATARPPGLGKNDQDVKLWLPLKMSKDLQALADAAELPLSVFLRNVLVTQIYGHQSAPAWPETMAAEQRQGLDKS
ncbi:MAG: hypothetical protein V4650_08470 [Pseudomonadota bacterium]